MLTNVSNDWSECLLQLPVDSIIKHVEQDNSLISNADIAVTLELDQELLNPVEAILVVSYLSNEKGSLDFLKILHLFGSLSLSELSGIF